MLTFAVLELDLVVLVRLACFCFRPLLCLGANRLSNPAWFYLSDVSTHGVVLIVPNLNGIWWYTLDLDLGLFHKFCFSVCFCILLTQLSFLCKCVCFFWVSSDIYEELILVNSLCFLWWRLCRSYVIYIWQRSEILSWMSLESDIFISVQSLLRCTLG